LIYELGAIGILLIPARKSSELEEIGIFPPSLLFRVIAPVEQLCAKRERPYGPQGKRRDDPGDAAKEDTMEQPSNCGKLDVVDLGRRVDIPAGIGSEIFIITISLLKQLQSPAGFAPWGVPASESRRCNSHSVFGAERVVSIIRSGRQRSLALWHESASPARE